MNSFMIWVSFIIISLGLSKQALISAVNNSFTVLPSLVSLIVSFLIALASHKLLNILASDYEEKISCLPINSLMLRLSYYIGMAKKFFFGFVHNILQENPNKLFVQPDILQC